MNHSKNKAKLWTCQVIYLHKMLSYKIPFSSYLTVAMRISHALLPKHEVDLHGNIYQKSSFILVPLAWIFFLFSFHFLFICFLFHSSFFSFFSFLEEQKSSVGRKARNFICSYSYSDSSQLMRFLWTLGRWKYPTWLGHTCLYWAWM